VKIFFCIDLLALKFGTYIINIEKFLFQKISWQNFFFNPWEAVKVGNSEKNFTATHVGRFLIYIFLVNLLAFKFGAHIINLEMILYKKFCDKNTNFSALKRLSKLADVKFPSLRFQKRHFDCHPTLQ